MYIRYLSFDSQEEMEKEIQKRQPYKIDIGAVFTAKVIRKVHVKYIQSSMLHFSCKKFKIDKIYNKPIFLLL